MLDALLDINIFLAAGIIFALRVVDVALGTLRTISLVQSRIWLAMGLGFVEVLVWIVVIAEVMTGVAESPFMAVAYAAGFAAGNGVGILIDRRLALGNQVLRIISPRAGDAIAARIRADGQPVTTFAGKGRNGPVTLLYVTCARRAMRRFLKEALELDPKLFYVVEPVSGLNRRLPGVPRPGGWRVVAKRK